MDTECCVHPHLYAGTLTLVSLVLGILVGLAGAAAKAVLSGGSSAAAAGTRRKRPVVLRPPARLDRLDRLDRLGEGRARTVAGRGRSGPADSDRSVGGRLVGGGLGAGVVTARRLVGSGDRVDESGRRSRPATRAPWAVSCSATAGPRRSGSRVAGRVHRVRRR